MHVIQGHENLLYDLDHFPFGQTSACNILVPINDELVQFAMAYEFRDNEVKLVIMEQLVNTHDIRVRGVFQDLKFAGHELLQYLVFLDFVFPYNLDSALDLALPMHSDSDLTKASFSENSANLVPFLDVIHLLKPFKVFKAQNMLKPLLSSVHAIISRIQERITNLRGPVSRIIKVIRHVLLLSHQLKVGVSSIGSYGDRAFFVVVAGAAVQVVSHFG